MAILLWTPAQTSARSAPWCPDLRSLTLNLLTKLVNGQCSSMPRSKPGAPAWKRSIDLIFLARESSIWHQQIFSAEWQTLKNLTLVTIRSSSWPKSSVLKCKTRCLMVLEAKKASTLLSVKSPSKMFLQIWLPSKNSNVATNLKSIFAITEKLKDSYQIWKLSMVLMLR